MSWFALERTSAAKTKEQAEVNATESSEDSRIRESTVFFIKSPSVIVENLRHSIPTFAGE
jgi:hypothetical protein